jgi:inner membrane protein
MDPIAHTLTGAALAAMGLRRATPLATAALVIGANVPDIDVLASFVGDSYSTLAIRRGWTHGVLALAVLPFAVTGLLLLWDRLRAGWAGRLRAREPGSPRASPGMAAAGPARAGPLLALTTLAILTHPTLDWLNNYGMRWLMPFDGRWFYGDALFIVDPWVWLALGGVLFLSARRAWSLALWGAFWIFGTWLLFRAPFVPGPARALWLAGVVAWVALRFLRPQLGEPPAVERLTRAVLGCVAAYMIAAVAASALARREVRDVLAARGIGPVTSVMVGPMPANPFTGAVVVATPTAYHLGDWRWFAEPRFTLRDQVLERRDGDPAVAAASGTRAARDYLTWSRYPYFEVEARGDGSLVRLSDARYREFGSLEGPEVVLDRELRQIAAE